MGSKRSATERPWRVATMAVVLAGLPACGIDALEPQGSNAQRISTLTIGLLTVGTFVFVLVLALFAAALFRRPGGDISRPLILFGGIALPAVVLMGVAGASLWVADGISAEDPDPLVVEITGHQFWWDVRYPDHDVRTANEVHLPVGRPVRFELTSADVIHSFWVPQLAGKRDLVPGRTTTLRATLDEPGRLAGYCAEFCGIQHANMRIEVVGHEPDDFEGWIEHQRTPATVHTEGTLLAGQDAFLGSSCVYCHRVEGTNASSDLGPDLTHLMSRERIGAGALPLTRGDLAGWILDPQGHKPGNRMPATHLAPDQLNALLDYLETLE